MSFVKVILDGVANDILYRTFGLLNNYKLPLFLMGTKETGNRDKLFLDNANFDGFDYSSNVDFGTGIAENGTVVTNSGVLKPSVVGINLVAENGDVLRKIVTAQKNKDMFYMLIDKSSILFNLVISDVRSETHPRNLNLHNINFILQQVELSEAAKRDPADYVRGWF